MTTQPVDVKAEKRRLSGQCATILGRLQSGRASNIALSQISLKYTGRISELRKRGHDIRVILRDHATGLAWYALFVNGKETP